MNFVKRMGSYIPRHKYVWKYFEELRRGDKVFHPNLRYIRPQPVQLTEPKTIKKDNYVYHNFKAIDLDFETLTPSLFEKTHVVNRNKYVSVLKRFEAKTGRFKTEYTTSYPVIDMRLFEASGIIETNQTEMKNLKDGDVIMINGLQSISGHLILNCMNGGGEFNEMPFWIGNILDMNLNDVGFHPYSIFPDTMINEGINENGKFKVIDDDLQDAYQMVYHIKYDFKKETKRLGSLILQPGEMVGLVRL